MDAFSIEQSVNVHDLDFNGVAKTSSIMRYIQTAAQSQLTVNGMSYDQLKDKKKAFVLSRIHLEVHRPLRECAPLTSISYPCESRGYRFLRCYELRMDGAAVARAISVWALIDTDSRALVKVSDFELGLSTLPPLDLAIGAIKLPSELTDVGGYGVHYGDVDRNMHMNNTKYPDMYSNFLPLAGKMIGSISINYSNEARLGEKLRVQRASIGDTHYFRTIRGDGKINSEAEIKLVDII